MKHCNMSDCKEAVAVSCGSTGYMLWWEIWGFWLTGRLGCAWVGAWVHGWVVHGWKQGGGILNVVYNGLLGSLLS